MNPNQIQLAINYLQSGKIGVIPTDTIFGISTNALDQSSVEMIYEIKGRHTTKPFIVLIGGIAQLSLFNITLNSAQSESLTKIWPGQYSIIIPCEQPEFNYLHRNTNSIAFRIPDNNELLEIINATGPIVATSANISGLPTPQNINEVKTQLPSLDFYIDGTVGIKPSRLGVLNQDGTISWIERS